MAAGFDVRHPRVRVRSVRVWQDEVMLVVCGYQFIYEDTETGETIEGDQTIVAINHGEDWLEELEPPPEDAPPEDLPAFEPVGMQEFTLLPNEFFTSLRGYEASSTARIDLGTNFGRWFCVGEKSERSFDRSVEGQEICGLTCDALDGIANVQPVCREAPQSDGYHFVGDTIEMMIMANPSWEVEEVDGWLDEDGTFRAARFVYQKGNERFYGSVLGSDELVARQPFATDRLTKRDMVIKEHLSEVLCQFDRESGKLLQLYFSSSDWTKHVDDDSEWHMLRLHIADPLVRGFYGGDIVVLHRSMVRDDDQWREDLVKLAQSFIDSPCILNSMPSWCSRLVQAPMDQDSSTLVHIRALKRGLPTIDQLIHRLDGVLFHRCSQTRRYSSECYDLIRRMFKILHSLKSIDELQIVTTQHVVLEYLNAEKALTDLMGCCGRLINLFDGLPRVPQQIHGLLRTIIVLGTDVEELWTMANTLIGIAVDDQHTFAIELLVKRAIDTLDYQGALDLFVQGVKVL